MNLKSQESWEQVLKEFLEKFTFLTDPYRNKLCIKSTKTQPIKIYFLTLECTLNEHPRPMSKPRTLWHAECWTMISNFSNFPTLHFYRDSHTNPSSPRLTTILGKFIVPKTEFGWNLGHVKPKNRLPACFSSCSNLQLHHWKSPQPTTHPQRLA